MTLSEKTELPVVERPAADDANRETLLAPPDHVLSTLEKDGRRRWLKPKLAKGRWWQRRRIVAYVLMVIFMVVPHLRIGGSPLIRLDITAREFTLFGHTFLPTDTLLLALAMLTALIGIVLITAITGRAWCGWACPQTVYIEFLFRPIDRWFEGTVGKGGKQKKSLSVPKQIARFLVYLVLNMVLAHTFLSYFVGPERLAQWIQSSPVEHPVAFLVMAATTGLLTYDFYFFREQTCLIACPYGRFQSVMLDCNSTIVAYDDRRGEPRKKGKHHPHERVGDCVDCNQCVVVCPTGIDIRDGLQMECINCTQCIDACDKVMAKVGSPTGLIRYSSQSVLSGNPPKYLRARTIVYPAILILVVSGLVYGISTKFGFDARVLRGKGAPFTTVQPGTTANNFSIRLVNRTKEKQTYQFQIISPESAVLDIIDPSTLELAANETSQVPLQVRFPSGLTLGDGNEPIEVRINDSGTHQRALKFDLLGPQ